MAEVDPLASPRRHPRRGDKVVEAPFTSGGVSGEVVTYLDSRVTVKTSASNVYVEITRFTWSPRRKAWVCWPSNIIRALRTMDKLEDRLTMPSQSHARLGEYVSLESGSGWVVRHIGYDAALGHSATMTSLKAYEVCLASGRVEIPFAGLVFDSARRLWIGRENA